MAIRAVAGIRRPVPLSELAQEHVELIKRGCAEWQEPYAKENETAYVHHSICFNADGTVRELLTPSVGALLGNYEQFGDKKIARSITVWPGGATEVHATRRETHLGAIAILDSRNGEETSHKLTGTNRDSQEISYLLDLLVAGRFPDRHYEVYEADWGQSAVTFAGVDTVRIARGNVDKDNQPISGQAYWFDSSGLLRGDYEEPGTTTYSEFVSWKNKQVPRRLEVTANGTRKWLILIEKLEPVLPGTLLGDSDVH